MTGGSDLDELIRSLEPVQVTGEFVFVSLDRADPGLPALAMVRESEGFAYVLERSEADRRSMVYDYVAAWITLQVHSSLDAIGLTAAVSEAVAGAGISCNVLAGRFHDHLLVPYDRATDTLAALRHLSDR